MPTPLFDSLPDAMKTLNSRPLFTLRGVVKPLIPLGLTPNQERRLGIVTGGVFEGERLRGEVLDGGADWQTVRGDGVIGLDVRLLLKTDDGALIGMTYTGLRHGPTDLLAALQAGEPVDPALYYFRIQAVFETAAPHYAWLNKLIAVGVGHRLPDGPVYSLFEIV